MNSWEKLALFEIRDLCDGYYNQKHGLTLNDRKHQEIKTNIQQARAYFASASNAAEIVKPIMVYCGVLTLSRAALIFIRRPTSFYLS